MAKSRRARVGDILVAARDSADLGLDRGMQMRVAWIKGAKMDVDVPSLDARISGIRADHPDIVPVQSPIMPAHKKSAAQLAREVKAAMSAGKQILIVEYDITALDRDAVDGLTAAAMAQSEGGADYPEVSATYRIERRLR